MRSQLRELQSWAIAGTFIFLFRQDKVIARRPVITDLRQCVITFINLIVFMEKGIVLRFINKIYIYG